MREIQCKAPMFSASDSLFSHFHFIYSSLSSQTIDDNPLTLQTRFIEEINKRLTIFMHHNTFELGVDRFNEALFVQSHFLSSLKEEVKVDGEERKEELVDNSIYTDEDFPSPPFVSEIVQQLWSFLIEKVGLENNFDTKKMIYECIQSQIICPLIGSTVSPSHLCSLNPSLF